MDQNEFAACLMAAQDDVARIFQGYEVPEHYRERLIAYIQRWYVDQGGRGGRVCILPGRPRPALQ
jgi:hypothetical protein